MDDVFRLLLKLFRFGCGVLLIRVMWFWWWVVFLFFRLVMRLCVFLRLCESLLSMF